MIDTSHDFAQKTAPKLQLVKPRVPGVEYYVDHHDNTFYILTNADDAKNFKLVQAPDNAIGKSNWTDLITMKSTEKIEDVDLFHVS